MKKLISLAIVSLMIVALMVPAFAFDAGKGTPSANTSYNVKQGTPTIDGKISEAEWGAPLIQVRAADAVSAVYSQQNNAIATAVMYNEALIEEPYPDTMTIYSNWDSSYLYIGVVYYDGDGYEYYANKGIVAANELWKNDTIQIGIEAGLKNQGTSTKNPFSTNLIDQAFTNFTYALVNNGDGTYKLLGEDYRTMAEMTYKEGVKCQITIDGAYRYYEYAIPTSYIATGSESPRLEAGANYAIAIYGINCNEDSGTDQYAQILMWGAGIGYVGNNEALGGNNQLTLVAEKATGPAHEHSFNSAWNSDGTNHWHACSCGERKDVAAHTGGTATCNTKAVCSVCGTRYGEVNANNHVGKTEIRGLKPATTTEEGYTGDTYCLSCNQVITKGKVLPVIDDSHEHSFGDEWLSDGTGHWHVCETCYASADKADHAYGEWTVTAEATDTANGSRERTCSECGYKDVEIIEGGHEADPGEVTPPNGGNQAGNNPVTGDMLYIAIAVAVVALGGAAIVVKKVTVK